MLEDQPPIDDEVDPTKAKEWSDAFSTQATGTPVPDLQNYRTEQLARTAGASSDPEAYELAIKRGIYGMAGVSPRNELEGMLVSQMIATHENAMKSLYFAAESLVCPETRDREMRYAAKLMQIFTQQATVLNKLRGSELFASVQGVKGAKNPYAKDGKKR